MKNASVFTLHMQTDLSPSDHKVLALLYQPMMGLPTHALYLTFANLCEKDESFSMVHADFFDLFDLKQAEFLKYRHRLEALSLLTVYQKDDDYIYVVKTPLSAKQFLVDTVFGSYLQSEIGEKNIDRLIGMFEIDTPKTDAYKNITKSFDQMYEFKSLNLLAIDKPIEGRVNNGGSTIRYAFDYNAFVERLPERLKSSQLLNGHFKDQITRIAFVYQFEVDDMVAIYEEATQSRQNVNFHQLNLKARIHYQTKNKQLEIREKDLDETSVIGSVTPQVIIQKYAKTDQRGLALSTASQLLERNHVDPGIINVILIFVLKNKDGVLPNINYMEKVLNDWLSKGIQTTEDAMRHSTEIENTWQKNQTRTKKAAEPDWMDDYLAGLAKMEG
jgi:replication initiation and membrane attachment protein